MEQRINAHAKLACCNLFHSVCSKLWVLLEQWSMYILGECNYSTLFMNPLLLQLKTGYWSTIATYQKEITNDKLTYVNIKPYSPVLYFQVPDQTVPLRVCYKNQERSYPTHTEGYMATFVNVNWNLLQKYCAKLLYWLSEKHDMHMNNYLKFLAVLSGRKLFPIGI